MKNALLLHGTGGSPQSFWLPWLKKELEKKKYQVVAPQLPQTDTPLVDSQLPFLLSQTTFIQETVIVAHSAGCALTLSVLEQIPVSIRQVIFVAGYARPLRTPGPHNDIVQSSYDWKRIKSQSQEFVFICSNNDPWGADEAESRFLFDHLGGMLIIRHGDGHMGSDTFHQPYKKFPLLMQLISPTGA